MTQTTEYDAFISYSRLDERAVTSVAEILKDTGLRVWFDKWCLVPGAPWASAMFDAMAKSRSTIICIGPSGVDNDQEMTRISARNLPDREEYGSAIAVLLPGAPPRFVPTTFRALAFVDLRNGIKSGPEINKLIATIKSASERLPENRSTRESDAISSVHPLPRGSRMPLPPNPRFVGRENELRELNRMLTPDSSALTGVHAAVIGMGGVGKTQLAVEYAHRYGHLYKGGVFWLNFAGEEDPIHEVARCGGQEGMDLEGWSEMTVPEQAVRVQRSWEENGSPSLLIFDDAEEPGLIEKWRPKHGHCSILITSRRSAWPPELGLKPLSIETLSREDNVKLLAEVRPAVAQDSKERQTAHMICDRLGNLPLALTVAAAYLQKYKSESLSEYLKALSIQPAIQDASLQSVYASFAVSFNKLNPSNPADALAQRIFYFASWFAPVSINRNLLIASAGTDSTDRTAQLRTDDALTRLEELGLMKEDTDGRLVLHPLLREFARLKSPQDVDQAKALEIVGEILADFARREFEIGLPQALARERAHLRQLASETENLNPDLAAELYSYLGANGRVLALFNEAKTDSEKALAIGEKTHGSDHPDIAIHLNNLGNVLRDLGDWVGARGNYERALRIDETVYGPDHPKVAIRINNLASLLWKLQDLPGARAYYQRALSIAEAAYGSDNPRVATYINNLGLVLRDLGDLTAARSYFERSLKIGEAVFGPDHPEIAKYANNLGSGLQDLGDLQGARANFERALKIDEAVYGPEHPSVARDVNNLGLLLKELGDLAGARAHYERSLKIDEAVYGPEHPDVAIDVSNLGSLLRDLGDMEGARANFERALKIFKKFLGDDHPKTRLIQDKLDALALEENQQKKSR